MIQLERAGTPAAAIVASGFAADARATAAALGMAGFRVGVTEDCLTSLAPEETIGQVDRIVDVLIDSLMRPAEVEGRTCDPDARPSPAEAETFEGANLFEAFEAMNAEFLDRSWGDGFPLLPPTPERVREMLAQVRRDPQDVVAVLEPGLGFATVEKIAVNAVMAGCRPEHLPILVAAVEAISDPAYHLRMIAMSTSPHAPLIVVNGPIAKRLGISSGRCALGPGSQSRVNTVIGRALRLIMMNVGHAYPDVMDLDTIGSPAKYSMCVAENEDRNPWETLHQERGFRQEQSTVTVFSAKSLIEVNDLRSYTPEGILTTLSASAALPGGEHMDERRVYHHVLLLAPDHARAIAKAGWTKQGIREYLYHKTTLPWRVLRNQYVDEGIRPDWRWVLNLPPETPLPVVGGPDWYQIVVVGGPAGKTLYIPGEGRSVTRLVEESRSG